MEASSLQIFMDTKFRKSVQTYYVIFHLLIRSKLAFTTRDALCIRYWANIFIIILLMAFYCSSLPICRLTRLRICPRLKVILPGRTNLSASGLNARGHRQIHVLLNIEITFYFYSRSDGNGLSRYRLEAGIRDLSLVSLASLRGRTLTHGPHSRRVTWCRSAYAD